MDVAIRFDGGLVYRTARSEAGNFLRLPAEMDTIVVASSCPQDLMEISRGGPTDVLLERLG